MRKIFLIVVAGLTFILSSCNQKQDFQDAGKHSSDEFLQALYHNDIHNFPYIGKTQELNEAFFTEKCISLLKENYEYDGDGLAVWDLFGGSNTSVWGSFKDMRYYQKGWYVLSFVYEEYWGESEGEYYIEDAPKLYLKVIQQNERWVIDEYKLQ